MSPNLESASGASAIAAQSDVTNAPVAEKKHIGNSKNDVDGEFDLKTEPDALNVDTIEAATEYSDAYFRKLLWKIDLWLLPVMWICYGTQQADKTSLSVQAVFGIREDTGLVGEQFNWLSTIFYLAYLVCEG